MPILPTVSPSENSYRAAPKSSITEPAIARPLLKSTAPKSPDPSWLRLCSVKLHPGVDPALTYIISAAMNGATMPNHPINRTILTFITAIHGALPDKTCEKSGSAKLLDVLGLL